MAAVDTDYHQRDLYEHIRDGDYPSWTLKMQIMPFEEAKTYRFNPFDLTKVWPHGDYPLIPVGQADAEPQRHRLPHRDRAGGVRAEQRWCPAPACRRTRCCWPAGSPTPTRTAPGWGSTTSRSRSTRPKVARAHLLQGRRDADPQRHGSGVRAELLRRPGRPQPERTDDGGTWHSDGEMVRTAYTLRPEDDDWGQAGTMVREVLDDAARDRLVDNIVGHLLNAVSTPVLLRAVRVLAQRGQGPRRPDRGRRPCQAGRDGPQGRRAGQPVPGERAGQGLTARRGVHHHPAPRPDRARGSCPQEPRARPFRESAPLPARARHFCRGESAPLRGESAHVRRRDSVPPAG